MKNAYCRTWNMEIKLKYMKDEKSTSKTRNMVKNPGKLGKKIALQDLKYGEKIEKRGK